MSGIRALPFLILASVASADPTPEVGFGYVKIIDRGGFTDSPSSPGSDIDAIELVRNGEVIGAAAVVIASKIGQGEYGNEVPDPARALGPPDHPPHSLDGFVALGGPGNYLVLALSTPARLGDVLRVHEIGARFGGRAEHTEVCIGLGPDGPFKPLGSGWAEFEVRVTDEPVADAESRCRTAPNV